MGRLTGQRAVVTGGANGIGRAIATAFAREGCDVFFTALCDEAAARSTRDELRDRGVRADYMLLDGADPDSVLRLLNVAAETLGLVDILVNNAATTTRTRFLDLTPDEYERVMAVNLRFPFFTTQAFAERLRAASAPGSVIGRNHPASTSHVPPVPWRTRPLLHTGHPNKAAFCGQLNQLANNRAQLALSHKAPGAAARRPS